MARADDTAIEPVTPRCEPRVEVISEQAAKEQAAKTNARKTNGAVATFAFWLMMPILRRTILVPEQMFGPVHRFRINWDETVSAS